MKKLQVIENNTYRKIFRAPPNTPVEIIRGEIGASCMESRLIKGKMLHYKSIIERSNEVLKNMLTYNKNDKWIKNLGKWQK